VALIAYFEKAVEDAEQVTYRFRAEEAELDYSFTIDKTNRRPVKDPDRSTAVSRLAVRGIMRSYREYGRWPDRGAGYT
jgi:hypothetical protein